MLQQLKDQREIFYEAKNVSMVKEMGAIVWQERMSLFVSCNEGVRRRKNWLNRQVVVAVHVQCICVLQEDGDRI
jgi:hypothetical protein